MHRTTKQDLCQQACQTKCQNSTRLSYKGNKYTKKITPLVQDTTLNIKQSLCSKLKNTKNPSVNTTPYITREILPDLQESVIARQTCAHLRHLPSATQGHTPQSNLASDETYTKHTTTTNSRQIRQLNNAKNQSFKYLIQQ